MKSFIERWVEYIRSNRDWRRMHNRFINSQLLNANAKLKQLSKDKLVELFKIGNKRLLRRL